MCCNIFRKPISILQQRYKNGEPYWNLKTKQRMKKSWKPGSRNFCKAVLFHQPRKYLGLSRLVNLLYRDREAASRFFSFCWRKVNSNALLQMCAKKPQTSMDAVFFLWNYWSESNRQYVVYLAMSYTSPNVPLYGSFIYAIGTTKTASSLF